MRGRGSRIWECGGALKSKEPHARNNNTACISPRSAAASLYIGIGRRGGFSLETSVPTPPCSAAPFVLLLVALDHSSCWIIAVGYSVVRPATAGVSLDSGTGGGGGGDGATAVTDGVSAVYRKFQPQPTGINRETESNSNRTPRQAWKDDINHSPNKTN